MIQEGGSLESIDQKKKTKEEEDRIALLSHPPLGIPWEEHSCGFWKWSSKVEKEGKLISWVKDSGSAGHRCQSSDAFAPGPNGTIRSKTGEKKKRTRISTPGTEEEREKNQDSGNLPDSLQRGYLNRYSPVSRSSPLKVLEEKL